MHNIFVVFLICTAKFALVIRIQNLPCFTDESQKDLEDARKELTTVDNYLEKTVKILADEFQKTLNIIKTELVTMQSNVSKIVQKVDTDLIYMSKDLEGELLQAVHRTVMRLCRDFGGYLVEIDNSSENEWLHSKRLHKNIGYWIGLTDLIEGEWRWSVDQSLATFKALMSSYGSKGHTSNCVSFGNSGSTWFDTSCKDNFYYICERNVCY